MRPLLRPTPHNFALLSFLTIYLLLLLDLRHWSARDPSSLFFNPERAFKRVYSLEREKQAESWIEATHAPYQKSTPEPPPSLCVGVATVQRAGARYFRRTVGSVLAGLTEAERRDIFLVSFIANVDPRVHEAFNEPWLPLLSDEVLTYENAAKDVLDRVRGLEHGDLGFDRKPLFDYTFLLRKCYERGMPYVVMLEDDVIAAEGWYARTKAALRDLEQEGSEVENTIYLRLFYNERILGWNSEEWFSYLLRCILVESLVLGFLLALTRYIPWTTTFLTSRTITSITLLIAPMCIFLYFAAGRLTVSPLPRGLNRMDTYGCCSQAFVFPRDQIPSLISFYEQVGQGKIDQLTEAYANEKGLARWALTPSVFAHVGSTSSKSSFTSRWGRSNTENIWNFNFEKFDSRELNDEHL